MRKLNPNKNLGIKLNPKIETIPKKRMLNNTTTVAIIPVTCRLNRSTPLFISMLLLTIVLICGGTGSQMDTQDGKTLFAFTMTVDLVVLVAACQPWLTESSTGRQLGSITVIMITCTWLILLVVTAPNIDPEYVGLGWVSLVITIFCCILHLLLSLLQSEDHRVTPILIPHNQIMAAVNFAVTNQPPHAPMVVEEYTEHSESCVSGTVLGSVSDSVSAVS